MTSLRKLRANTRRLTRLDATVFATLSAMKKGQALHRHHAWYGPAWFLTDGRSVPAEIAEIVIKKQTNRFRWRQSFR
jgi:hypothetical protein